MSRENPAEYLRRLRIDERGGGQRVHELTQPDNMNWEVGYRLLTVI